MTSEIQHVLDQVVQPIYQEVAADPRYPVYYNMAFSNQCAPLTRNLYIALENRGMPVRRELHKIDDGTWHFLIAHADPAAAPTDEDMITDLNPWQYKAPVTNLLTYLHGTRENVKATLAEYEAPDWFISLRGIETITRAHTLSNRHRWI